MSYAALFDPGLSGFIGNLPDRTSDVLRLLCGLNLIAFVMMVSALKPVYVGRFCHSFVGFPTRGPGSQLVNAACFLVPDDDARGNHSNTRFILVPAAGPYVQQRGCARALYYLTPGVLVVGDTSEVREGGKLPSLC